MSICGYKARQAHEVCQHLLRDHLTMVPVQIDSECARVCARLGQPAVSFQCLLPFIECRISIAAAQCHDRAGESARTDSIVMRDEDGLVAHRVSQNGLLRYEGTLDIKVYLTIVSISTIDEEKSGQPATNSDWIAGMAGDAHLSFSPLLRERLWVPDLLFVHATSIRQLQLYTPSEALQIYANNTVFLSSLMLVEYTCPMKYMSYPLDRQSCDVFMESSTYAAVGFRLNLQRKVQFYLLQTYLPSALLVAVAGVSFLVPASAVPGRMVLCITTLLAVTTMFAAERQAGPRVSYIKAMDVWMIGCMVFCFYSTVEYALVIRLGLSQEEKLKESFAVPSAPARASTTGVRGVKVQPLGQSVDGKL
ncbi:glycine receptor subunit alpha-3-like [Pollicipes pollicipes]|uniref:glycine receptor subunit alpha-3-like n=1 Tax=Pollicipes pollicipes TaxID=41117 RepID=UPI001884AF63|nr:glycine receptor subunit alpha-3-like [Pollicipes pollicipes]